MTNTLYRGKIIKKFSWRYGVKNAKKILSVILLTFQRVVGRCETARKRSAVSYRSVSPQKSVRASGTPVKAKGFVRTFRVARNIRAKRVVPWFIICKSSRRRYFSAGFFYKILQINIIYIRSYYEKNYRFRLYLKSNQ